MTTNVITHAGCVDGFTSAYLLYRAFPEADFHDGHYGTPPPAGLTGHVIVADFSYDRDTLIGMLDTADKVTVLDHHIGAKPHLEDLPPEIEVHFDLARCGASLVWQWLHPMQPFPTLVQYVEDRDLWQNTMPYTHELAALTHGTPFTFEAWEKLWNDAESDFPAVVAAGRAVLAARHKLVTEQAALAVPICIDGIWTVAAPSPYSIGSDVAKLLCDQNENVPFAAYFIDGPTGRKYGLRTTRDDFDVAAVAKRFGGSGHRAASGFTISATKLKPKYAALPNAAVFELRS